jgi:hypothetical protein
MAILLIASLIDLLVRNELSLGSVLTAMSCWFSWSRLSARYSIGIFPERFTRALPRQASCQSLS